MSNTQAIYNFDKLGRLQSAVFNNGASVTYSYDEAGNRSSQVEVPAVTPPTPVPTVSGLPKAQNGDFKNCMMVVMLTSGELMSWGDNTTGATANGMLATTSFSLPQKVLFDPNTTVPPSTATIVSYTLTNANLYVVYSNGWVYSAGSNNYGQLGHGDLTSRPFLKRIEYFPTNAINVTNVWANGGYSTTNGGGCTFFQDSNYNMYGCGLNTAGNLGCVTNPTTNQEMPVVCNGIPNTAASHVTNVAMATVGTSISTYMLTNNGEILVAGYNGQGQLALNSTVNQTGGFASATTSSGNVSNAKSISANSGGTAAGNALYLDSSGNVWTVGYNDHGELALGDTTNVHIFTQVTGLSNIAQAAIGGGSYGFGYAINTSGALYTWGYNNQNNLFLGNAGATQYTSPQAVPAGNLPSGNIAQLWFAKGNEGLDTTQQLIILTTTGQFAFAGANAGQVGIASPITDSPFSNLAMPQELVNGTDSIASIFVHGVGLTQRWFVLTANGNLYGCGDNTNSICNAAFSALSSTDAANSAVWQPIVLV